MENIKQELAEMTRNRPTIIKEAKEAGSKVIEFNGNFIPDEFIYAAGAEPYFICRGGEPEPPDAVLPYMLRFMNPLARSMAGFYMMGLDPITPIADIIVTQQTDCHVGRVSELMEYFGLPIYKVGVPSDWEKPFTADYYYNGLHKLKSKLEEITGNVIENEKLRKYIEASNKVNQALRKIDSLRLLDEPPVSGYDFIQLNHYSYFISPDIMAGKLEEIYNQLKASKGKFKKDMPRILLAGHAVAVGDYVVPKTIESYGAVIAAEMLDEGIRPYKWDVDLDGDLIDNIGKRNYLVKPPINIFQPAWKTRFKYLKKLIEDARIDGVIWYQLSFDEIYDMECSCVAKWLGEINVPFLKLESSYEYSRESMGPLTTRIESFIESVKGGKHSV